MSNVAKFNGTTLADIPSEQVLAAASSKGLDEVLILGWDKDGQPYFASSTGDIGVALHLIEKFKQEVV